MVVDLEYEIKKKTTEGKIRAMQEDINIEYDSKAK